LLGQHRSAHRGHDQVRECEQHAGKAHETNYDEGERRVKQEVPETHAHSLRERLLGIGRYQNEALVEGRVEGAQRREYKNSLADLSLSHVQDVAREQVLQLFLPTGNAAQ